MEKKTCRKILHATTERRERENELCEDGGERDQRREGGTRELCKRRKEEEETMDGERKVTIEILRSIGDGKQCNPSQYGGLNLLLEKKKSSLY